MNKPAFSTFDPRTARTWAEIDLGAVAANARALQRLAGPESEAVAVVKADAYGHGAVPVARAAAEAGIAHFAVASVAEAVELRAAGIRQEIYILSSFLPAEAETLVRGDIVPFVSSSEQAAALAEAASAAPLPARCFLVVDTGMGREGMLPEEAARLWEQTRRDPRGLRITGIATHFSRADEPGIGDTVTQAQAGAFFSFLAQIAPDDLARADDGRGNRGVYLTLANSPATLRLPHPPLPPGVRGYLKRAGLLLYGIEPYAGAFVDSASDLHPALSWRARVTLLRDLPAGATVGYGQTHTLTRPSRIATLPVGYADGLSRKLSNCGVIIAAGRRYSIVGRVSMDQCQIDVTDAGDSVRVGDVATILGTDGAQTQTVLDYATLVETTPHEPTCQLTRRVPRIYVRGAP